MSDRKAAAFLSLLLFACTLAVGCGSSSGSGPGPGNSTPQFVLTGSMATERYVPTATLLPNGKVLIAGGTNATSGALSSAELYDPSTGSFTPTGSLNTPRYWAAATLLNNGLVLVAGGYNASGFVGTAELYDPRPAPSLRPEA
jgi:Galactose oxidase, central domain